MGFYLRFLGQSKGELEGRLVDHLQFDLLVGQVTHGLGLLRCLLHQSFWRRLRFAHHLANPRTVLNVGQGLGHNRRFQQPLLHLTKGVGMVVGGRQIGGIFTVVAMRVVDDLLHVLAQLFV